MAKYLDESGLSYFWGKIKAKISSMISDEAGKMIPYGFCSTEAKTVAKTVTVSPSITELTTGLTIAVRFQYANTATNPTLNVNSLGAKSIYRYGSTVAGASAATSWNAQAVVTLTYNGSAWMLNDFNNTTYSALSATDMETGTATTARLITAQRLKQAVEYHAPVTSVNGQTGDVTVSGGSGTSTPTADTLAEFDSTAHMNSTDMTATEVSDFVDGLDAQGANLADYVVEQGTNGIWTYRKWNSGIAECWGYKLTSGTFSAWGSVYSHDIPAEAYPSGLFIEAPTCVGSAKCTSGNSAGGINTNGGTKDNACGFTLIRGTALSGNLNFLAFWIAKGRWK